MSSRQPKTIQQKIEQKRAELEHLQEIQRFTFMLTNQLEQLEEKLDTMADGAESAVLVLSNWQNVLKSISLASLGLMKYSAEDYETQAPFPERLVRIKLDKDDQSDQGVAVIHEAGLDATTDEHVFDQ